MHQESRKQNAAWHQAAASRGDLSFGTYVSHIERHCRSRHRGVSWPGCRTRGGPEPLL